MDRICNKMRVPVPNQKPAKDPSNSSSFVDNMQLPVHRWFRYSAGFSAQWVRKVIEDFRPSDSTALFDPFVGCGTTVVAGEECGVKSFGIDAHPFVVRIAKAKLNWRVDSRALRNLTDDILRYAKELPRSSDLSDEYPDLVVRCYSLISLDELDRLRRSWAHLDDGSPVSQLAWLALVAILRVTSSVGTAPWQYVLPRKAKRKTKSPLEAFADQAQIMIQDMDYLQSTVKGPPAEVFEDDARYCSKILDDSIDLVVTSPPYTNNYDYADATRLEMSFFGEIREWADLQERVRSHLIRSCSQHMRPKKDKLEEILNDNNLNPIVDELQKVCYALKKEREKHGGKKNYHLMVAAYFSDLSKVWIALRRLCKDEARICFVVGDSAPYGIHVPVDDWLGELALAAGFKSYRFEKTRDRNVKWHNRKHKVPLHEGRLWVGA